MLMIRQKQRGVSPVIGVILMVAITVIIAAVVANFVLGLAGNLEQDADATVTINQEVDSFADDEYKVNVTVSQMDNADYLIVKESTETDPVDVTHAGTKPSSTPEAPNTPAASSSASSSTAAVLVNAGDEVEISGLSAGDTVQIFGGLKGKESLIQSYDVQDTLS